MRHQVCGFSGLFSHPPTSSWTDTSADNYVEVTFYLSAVNRNPTTVSISLDLIHTVQHDYSMLAVFFPLGTVILGSRVLPHVFGYLALVLGGAFAIAGVVNLFSPIQNVVNDLSIIQGFWFLIAAITLLVFAGKASGTSSSSIDHLDIRKPT